MMMRWWRRTNSDLTIGIGLLALCAVTTRIVLALPVTGVIAGAPGARFFPLLLVAIIAGLALVLCASGARRVIAARGSEAAAIDQNLVSRVAITVGAMLGYVYLMTGARGWLRSAGVFVPRGYAFTVLTAVFLSIFFYLGDRRAGRSIILASAIALTLYVGFVAILNVRFP
jgi:hypothetical protein